MSQLIAELEEKISKAKSIAIISHSTPDVDAFASSVALREIIRKSQTPKPGEKRVRKKIDVFMEYDKLPQSLDIFFPKKDTGFRFLNPERQLKQYDLAIVLDCASKERMGIYTQVFEKAKDTVNIDHHATNTRFANANYVLKTSSTCEALYYMFLRRKKLEASKYILSLLYSGTLTDTNNLKNNADGVTTDRFVSEVKQKIGPSLAKKIRANFFESNSPAKDELYTYAYNKRYRRYVADGKFCMVTLNHRAFKTTGAELEDAEGIVDEALYRKGVIASALIIEKEKGQSYVKLRSKEGVNISELAKQFGGGGHEQVAAFQYEGRLSDLASQLEQKAEEFVEGKNAEEIDACPELFQ